MEVMNASDSQCEAVEKKCLQEMKERWSKIVFIESATPYSYVHLQQGEVPKCYRISLRKIVESFSENELLRVHKSYCVPIQSVQRIKRASSSAYRVHLKGGKKIPIGRTFVHQLRQEHDAWFNLHSPVL